jgi:hypothetical protein
MYGQNHGVSVYPAITLSHPQYTTVQHKNLFVFCHTQAYESHNTQTEAEKDKKLKVKKQKMYSKETDGVVPVLN